ncbi:MAG: MGMT family protein [Hyphomicrobiales bacterium]
MLLNKKDRPNSFYQKVYEVARQIPFGRVTSYGAIAKYLGAGRSSRMVGYALKSSASTENVPAHRVVNRNGLLTGRHHFVDPTLMEQLLNSEGVEVINNQVVDLKKHFWDPLSELS